jgi:NAD(P)H-dependent FMN reductase
MLMPVVLGSVRSDRKGARVAHFVRETLIARGHDAPLVDPIELKLPLLDRMYKEHETGRAPAVLEHLATLFRRADAFVLVSAEYNHSIPPALSNLLDHFLEEFFWRPSCIVCYSAGQFGGVRAAMQLRMMTSELGCPSIPSLLPVPRADQVLNPQGKPLQPWIETSAARVFSELEWYASAFKRQRAEGTPY